VLGKAAICQTIIIWDIGLDLSFIPEHHRVMFSGGEQHSASFSSNKIAFGGSGYMYLGIDVGTSGVKALLINDSGSVVANDTAPLDVLRPHAGWSEQNPADWWQAVNLAVQSLQDRHPKQMAKVLGIGLSGQMHGMVALDANDSVLRPAILWNDTRNAAEADGLDSGFPAFRKIGGNAVMPGFTAPKAVWMQRHEPELFAKINKILLPKDFIRLQMTGEFCAEMSDGAGTLWMDVAQRCWSDELLGACGLNSNQMPRLVEGSEISGTLRRDIATSWGIEGTPVVAGGAGDNAAAACGLGVTAPGDAFLSLGTSGVVFAVTDSFSPAPENGAHAFCHAIPGTWHQMGVILAATDCLNWLAEITGQTVAALMHDFEISETGPSPVLFHPYLSGERTPHNDAGVRGAFFGLSRAHDRREMTRAVVEGVAFALADAVDVLAGASARPSSLLATGGGARSRQWLQIIAAVTQCPITVPAGSDYGAALGAARLGQAAAGNLGAGELPAIMQKPDMAEQIDPDKTLTDAYEEAIMRWRHLYHAAKC
jgi:xylulokinase